MDIKHAKAILIIGFPGLGAVEVIRSLAGSTPQLTSSSLAGLTHQWHVKNKYYEATLPIWVDEVTDLEQWTREFQKPEAREVVEAIGAWLVCFNTQQADFEDAVALMKSVQEVIEQHTGSSNDAIMLAIGTTGPGEVAMSDSARLDWEDKTLEDGFELVDFNGKGSNEFGERQGMSRAKEALLAHEWSLPIDIGDEDAFSESNELQFSELVDGEGIAGAMRTALMADQEVDGQDENDKAAEVDDLDAMLGKLLVERDRIADLPEAQKKRAAADAVRKLMQAS